MYNDHVSLTVVWDDSLLTEGPQTGVYQFIVHPRETVHLPFKYQSFQSTHGCSSRSEQEQSEEKNMKVGFHFGFIHVQSCF